MPQNLIDEVGKLFDRGLVRRAVGFLNRALMLDPSLEPAWRTKYAFLSALGYTEAAVAVIEGAIQHVVNPELLISYATLLQSLERHSEAIAVFREYLTTAPEGEYASVAVGNIANSTLALNDAVGAEVLYRKAIEMEPSRATHYCNYARLLLSEKRFDAALPLVEKGLAAATEGATACRLLEDKAVIFAEQRRGEESLRAIDEALARGAAGARTQYLRGRALALLGRLQESRECMARVLAIEPNHADALRARKMIDKALQ